MKSSVLIVDDEEIIHRTVRRALEEEGVDLRDAYNGAEAIAAVCEKPVDLILLDINMPEMDGNGVMRELHGNPKTKNIPVMMLTARDEVIDRIVGYELGVIDYITKPFEVPDLRRRVKEFLNLGR